MKKNVKEEIGLTDRILIVNENAIMVYINRLRQKIEDDPEHPKYIQNVRGIGYRFVLAGEETAPMET